MTCINTLFYYTWQARKCFLNQIFRFFAWLSLIFIFYSIIHSYANSPTIRWVSRTSWSHHSFVTTVAFSPALFSCPLYLSWERMTGDRGQLCTDNDLWLYFIILLLIWSLVFLFLSVIGLFQKKTLRKQRETWVEVGGEYW